ncbi:MAG: metallophosphoesterase [Pyrinomonadaceae bacterium]|nr:metallophosphoesterase [Phycisphaerales bacterium]
MRSTVGHMLLRTMLMLMVCVRPALGQASSKDPGLIADWSTATLKVEGTVVTDGTGTVRATIVGKPTRVKLGPGEGTRFDGNGSWLVVADDIATSRTALPIKAFTASAWVNLSTTTEYGSITGAVQDNGDFEKGWMLGYTSDAFYIAVSSRGADDGDGKLTYLKGVTKIIAGRWYSVTGTYDGATMRLYVNGKLDAESKAQSGEILYPAHATYTIGAYIDDDETHAMDGSIADLKMYSRVLSVDSITQQYTAGLALASWEPPSTGEQDFLVRPYLQFATMDSMRIMFEAKRACTAHVEYGLQLPMDKKAESASALTMHEVVLDGLQPQTQYLYRVTLTDASGPTLQSDILTFQTAVMPDSPFAFAVIGDTQKNPKVIATLQKFAYSLRPNLEIHLGDVVDGGPDKNEWVNEMLKESHVLMSRVPMYPAIGNHEKDHSHYYQYFALPKPEYYYTYTYGNAQFFSLDTNRPVTPGSEQYKWLDAELSKSKAKWKFCYHHHPVYSSDENDYGDTYKGTSKWGDMKVRPLEDLYEKHHVDIVFNGHIHLYERSFPVRDGRVVENGGVIHITSGGGGGGLEAVSPTRSWFGQRFYAGHHVCCVTINGGSLQFQAFDLEGRLFDQMEIKKP